MMNAALKQRKRYRVDLRAMLARCESNYARLVRLLAMRERKTDPSLTVNLHTTGQRSMTVTVEETCPYTTMLRLELSALHEALPGPVMRVRLYHDARMAEVTAAEPYQRARARYDYPNDAMHQRDEKHQWNLFLSDWLAHVQDQGLHAGRVWEGLPGQA